jgi:hypothetical protein
MIISMFSGISDKFVALIAFLIGLSWAIVPNYRYFVDAIGYLNSFHDTRKTFLLWHPYHPLFPGLWKWVWSVNNVLSDPYAVLRSGGLAVSFFGGLGLWATYSWGRKMGLGKMVSLLGTAVLGGIGAWGYFSSVWACYIPSISLMLTAFLIVAGDGVNAKSGNKSIGFPVYRSILAGILLGLAASFHILAIFAIPGFLLVLNIQGRRVKHWFGFIFGFLVIVFIVWGYGGREYARLSGIPGIFNWVTSSYGADPRFWGPKNYLLFLHASYAGNSRTLFMGFFESEWLRSLAERFATPEGPGWQEIIELIGLVIGVTGILFLIGSLFYSAISRGNIPHKNIIPIQWGLIVTWLLLAGFSSIYVVYLSHYRLFAWAILWWLLLLLCGRFISGNSRQIIIIALLITAMGLWSHNLIAGPHRWGERGGNPYLVEVSQIGKTQFKLSPAIFESDSTGFARFNYMMLFRGGCYAERLDKVIREDAKYLIPQLESKGSFWISEEAIRELGWHVTGDGKVRSDNRMLRLSTVEFDQLSAILRIETPIGNIYLLSWV